MCYSGGSCKYEKESGECSLAPNEVVGTGFPLDALCSQIKMGLTAAPFEEDGAVEKLDEEERNDGGQNVK